MTTFKDELIDQILGNAKTEEDLFGQEGIIKSLSKRLMERLLDVEMTDHLGYSKYASEGKNSGNSRNGKTRKTIKTGNGEIEINVPRDRESEFTPVLIEKGKSRLAGLDTKILSLYGRGMTTRDIQEHLYELYGTEISSDLISTITDAVIEDVTAWRNRPLDALYLITFIDGFVAKCRLDGRVENRTVYIVFGINLEGKKEVLGLYLGAAEGAKFWLNVLTEIKNRGVKDVFILCADGLKGLSEAVEATFPKALFQTCIVHMMRNSLNYVPYNEKKAVANDLKKIYQADTEVLAAQALDDFELTWGEKYGAIVKLSLIHI